MIEMNRKEKLFFLLGAVCILVYYIPVLILGQNSHFILHDNLDGEFVYRILMNLDYSDKYNNGVIWQVMNGLPRDYLQTGLNITVLLFGIFSPFTAYIINDILARLIAYLGMYLLLKTCILERTSSDLKANVVAVFFSLFFAFIPTYTIYGCLTVMGQPLLLWVFINLWKRKAHWYDYAIIVLFPFCSSFFLSGFFICIALFIWWGYGYISLKKINGSFLGGVVLLSAFYLLTEYNMIFSVLFGNNQSHRLEFSASRSFLESMYETIQLVMVTQYHSGSILSGCIIVLVLVLLFIKRKIRRVDKILILCISVILVINMFYLFSLQYAESVKIIRIFQWNRFYFLLPLLWTILYADITNQIFHIQNKRKQYSYAFTILMISFSCVFLLYKNEEFKGNIRELAGKIFMKESKSPSFSRFFASPLFDEIKNYIGKEQSKYRVICLGMHPSVAIYNGYFTLDSYQTSYPLEYKHEFRRIICKELDKDSDLKRYFDNWGSRCYMYSSELGRNWMISKYDTLSVKYLDVNVAILKEMGAEYLFSTVKIENAEQLGFDFEKIFEDSISYWRIYLYKINEKNSSF